MSVSIFIYFIREHDVFRHEHFSCLKSCRSFFRYFHGRLAHKFQEGFRIPFLRIKYRLKHCQMLVYILEILVVTLVVSRLCCNLVQNNLVLRIVLIKIVVVTDKNRFHLKYSLVLQEKVIEIELGGIKNFNINSLCLVFA